MERFFVLLLAFSMLGCGDEVVVSRQVWEIISPPEGVVTAPPSEVWEGIRHNRKYMPREEGFEAEQQAFYTKYIDADGIAILAHTTVEDRHLIEARQVVLTMTAKHPALRDRLRVKHGFYMILYRPATGPGDMIFIPEFYNAREGYYYEKNTCRMAISRWGDEGGVKGFCAAGVQHEYAGHLRVFVHEFAHALDSEIQYLTDRALLASGVPVQEAYNSSREFFDQLKQAYQQAKASDAYRNLWDPYIMEDSREYWAEGVEIWYYGIGDGREFETHEAFAAVDPLLYELLSEWFYKGSFPRTLLPGWPQYDLMWEQEDAKRR